MSGDVIDHVATVRAHENTARERADAARLIERLARDEADKRLLLDQLGLTPVPPAQASGEAQ